MTIFFKQTAAHGYFIITGIWFWTRWQIGILLGFKQNSLQERFQLARRSRAYLSLLQRLGILRLEFVGFEDASQWSGCILSPNHPSIIDAVLIMSQVPDVVCVINSKLLANPLTSGVSNLCNFVRNDAPIQMMKECQQRLSDGSNILFFPEGTRTTTHPIGLFHHTYALAAKRAGVPIRTIVIECDSSYFGADFSLLRPSPCPMPISYRVSVGRIYYPTAETNSRALSAEIEEYFRETLSTSKKNNY